MNNQQSVKSKRAAYLGLLAIMVLIPIALAAYKLYVLNYPLAGLIPAPSYTVEVNMQADGHGEDIHIQTYLPKTDARQSVDNEESSTGAFVSNIRTDSLNREVLWNGENVTGQHNIRGLRIA